jgi:hypothetical protein
MRERSPLRSVAHQTNPTPKYLSSEQLGAVLGLLWELCETTQSRASHARATDLIRDLGGDDRLARGGES